MIKINISEDALKWFKDEVELGEGSKVRFFSQIYGTSKIRENFSLAFTIDPDDEEAASSVTVEGITFYVNESDLWFFDGHDLFVLYDEKLNEVTYDYKK